MINLNKFKIPRRRKELLFTSNRSKDEIPRSLSGIGVEIDFNSNETDFVSEWNHDPSLIFKALPVKEPIDKTKVESIGYFPSYLEMNKYQRWIYLNWLSNIEESIDISYVFTYYYGLERHLWKGDINTVFNEIMLLRNNFKNLSFQKWSFLGLLKACSKNDKKEFLNKLTLLEPTNGIYSWHHTSNILNLKYRQGQNLNLTNLLKAIYSLRNINKRYIKKNPEVYKNELRKVLLNRFNIAEYPFRKDIDKKKLEKNKIPAYANISIPDNEKYFPFLQFTNQKSIYERVINLHEINHERVKRELRKRRN